MAGVAHRLDTPLSPHARARHGDQTVGFIVAGVQKAGTTALFDYLKTHRDLALAEDKEVHFFDDEETVDWSAPDYGAYHARFPAADGRLRGEATPIYLYWPNALKRIRAYDPDIRLIAIFRDPAERAWSHWRMETRRGAETLPFDVCIRQGRERVETSVAPPGHHRVHSYVERGFYGAQLRRLFALFPREQVFLGTSRALRAEPALFLRNVCDFLGIARFRSVTPIESHVASDTASGRSIPANDRDYLNTIYEEDQKLFQTLSGLSF